MKIYTAHLHGRRAPALVPEGISWAALFFGPLWLLRHGAWIAGGLALAAFILACLAPPALRPLATFAVLLAVAIFGNDLRRWNLALRGWQLAHPVAACSRDEALLRLLTHRPDLRSRDLRVL